jgi:hypothetical protein
VWVQSDFAEAERRGIARDIAQGVNGDPEASTRFSDLCGCPHKSAYADSRVMPTWV